MMDHREKGEKASCLYWWQITATCTFYSDANANIIAQPSKDVLTSMLYVPPVHGGHNVTGMSQITV